MESTGQEQDTERHSSNSIGYSKHYFKVLQSMVHDADTLSKQGYLVEPFTASDFEGFKRCSGCNIRTLPVNDCTSPLPSFPIKAIIAMKKLLRPQQATNNISRCASNRNSMGPEESKTPKLRCLFHPGTPVKKMWTCCRRDVSAEPCAGLKDHIAADYPRVDQLERIYQYHVTPCAKPRKVCHIAAQRRWIYGDIGTDSCHISIDTDLGIKLQN